MGWDNPGGGGGGPGTHAGLPDVTPDQHHAEIHAALHALAGADPVSAASIGAAAAAHAHAHADLAGIGAGDHHATDHDHDGSPTQQLAAANTHGSPGADTHHNRDHSIIGATHTGFPGGTTDFLRADGSFATPAGGGGAGQFGVLLRIREAYPNQPVADGEWGGQEVRPIVDLDAYTEFRVTVSTNAAGATGADVRVEGSTDGVAFSNLDGGAGPELAIDAAQSQVDTGWVTLDAAFQAANIYLRVMGKDGNAAADPAITAWITFRP